MKAKLILASITFITGTSMFALADENEQQFSTLHAKSVSSIMVNIDKDQNNDATVELKIDGESYSFTLPELEQGETREIITDEGQTVVLMRPEDGISVDSEQGISVNIDGKEIMLHSFDSKFRQANVFAFSDIGAINEDKSLVISGGALDEDTRARIKDAIAAAGIDRKVIFPATDMNWGIEGGAANFELILDEDMLNNSDSTRVIKIKQHIISSDEQ